MLYGLGPWQQIHRSPNNFAHHAAFQGSYEPISWENSVNRHIVLGKQVRADEISDFYLNIAARSDFESIIEYPTDIANANNLLWYYQHFHRKRVIAGYVSDPDLVAIPSIRNAVITAFPLDYVMSRLSVETRFRNLVDVVNPNAVIDSGGSFLVFHKSIPTVIRKRSGYDVVSARYPSVATLIERYQSYWGRPAYEDEEIVVFSIPDS